MGVADSQSVAPLNFPDHSVKQKVTHKNKMKVEIEKKHLLAGLQTVANVICTRTTLPILGNVLVKAEAGRINLVATNLDIFVETDAPATVKTKGSITVPAKKMIAIISSLNSEGNSEDVDMELEKGLLTIASGSSRFKLNCIRSEEFPPTMKVKPSKKFKVSQEKLFRLLNMTSFCICTDESRYVLCALFLKIKDGKITSVATDGRRMATFTEDIGDEKADMEMLIPTRTAGELRRLLTDKGDVEVEMDDNGASFSLKPEEGKGEPIVILSKLVAGNFPNHNQVIPREVKHRVQVPRETFALAMRRADLMTSDKSSSVRLKFDKNNLRITANSPEVGEAKEDIEIKWPNKPFSIAFNPSYLIDPVANLTEEEITLELVDEISPCVIRNQDGKFLSVVMPMRLSDTSEPKAAPEKKAEKKSELAERSQEEVPAGK